MLLSIYRDTRVTNKIEMIKLHQMSSCVYSVSVGEIYEEHKDEDGFLYVQYSGENTFGCHPW